MDDNFENPDVKQVYTTWDMGETSESLPSKMTFKEPIKHDVKVHNALKMGDEVILLNKKGAQKYLVVDRVVKT